VQIDRVKMGNAQQIDPQQRRSSGKLATHQQHSGDGRDHRFRQIKSGASPCPTLSIVPSS
jgi:hypothetical protein